MEIIKNTQDTLNNALKFGRDVFQGIARDTMSVGLEVSRGIKSIDDRLTGGILDLPTSLKFDEEDSLAGKVERGIFGTPEGRTEIGGFAEEGEYISDLYSKAYGLSKEDASKFGYGTQALFALTSFIPAKKSLIKSLIKESNPENVVRILIEKNVAKDVANNYASLIAKSRSGKEIQAMLNNIEKISNETKMLPSPSEKLAIGERQKISKTIQLPPTTPTGRIKIRPSSDSPSTVRQLISLKEQASKISNRILNKEKTDILKSSFKSTLQKQQEEFSLKLVDTINKFKESGEKIAGAKKELFNITKKYFPDGDIKTNLAKKISEARTPAQIRSAIFAIGKEKDKSIREELIGSIHEVIDGSSGYTIRQQDRIASTMNGLSIRGMKKETAEKLSQMRDYFNRNEDRELLLGNKNTKLLNRAEDLSKKPISKLTNKELRELERRLRYIDNTNSLEIKTKEGTKKLQKEITVDTLSAEAHNMDIGGKISSLTKELTSIEKLNNFWSGFKDSAQKANWAWISADNFFSELGGKAKEIFKDTIDKASNLSKKEFSIKANNLLGYEAELFKKYGKKLTQRNYKNNDSRCVRTKRW